MYSLKRILVGLDLSQTDEVLLKYTEYLCGIFDISDIYFIHIAKSFDLPKDLLNEYPDLLAPVDETITHELQRSIDASFPNTKNIPYRIEVKEGNPTEKILKWSEIKEIDLIIMGKKTITPGKGILPGKLVKFSHCSILFVPETASVKITKIVAPVDFSKTSQMAIELCGEIRQKNEAELLVQHSYQVPIGYHKSGKSYEEFADILRSHLEKDMQHFLQNIDSLDEIPRSEIMLDKDDDPSDQIHRLAVAEEADLIIAGSKGRSEIAAILMGSVAEKICKSEHGIPILIIKDKKENMGFLQALLKL